MKNWLRRWLGVEQIGAVYVIRPCELLPDDVLLVHADGAISQETAEIIKAHITRQFPDRKCLVMGNGLKLGILSPRGRKPSEMPMRELMGAGLGLKP